MYKVTENESLNKQNKSKCNGFKNKIEEFQKIYTDSYRKPLSEKETEINLLEITQLLEEIIKINYR